MSGNWGYTRKFIILKRDFSNMYNLNPKGHGKLELRGIKGNITISIENAEENNYYNVMLLNNNAMEIIGKVYTEENGKGKAEISLNLQDLEAKGFSARDINGILLLRDSDILLGGYIEKDDQSIENYIISLRAEVSDYGVYEEETVQVSEEAEVDKVELVEAEIDETEIEETELEVTEIEETEIEAAAEEEEKTEEVKLEEPRIEEVEVAEIEPDIIDETDPIYHTEAKEPSYEPIEPAPTSVSQEEVGEEIDYYDNLSAEYNRRIEQRNQTTNYILSILRFFPFINPFTINLQGYNWWRIDYQEGLEERGFLPYFSYLLDEGSYAANFDVVTAKDLLLKYQHYIFGLYNVKDEVKYYVYGVPGKFNKDEHPHNGKTGFNTWFEGYEIDGYWLLYIDPLSGRVIYPANPMEPAN